MKALVLVAAFASVGLAVLSAAEVSAQDSLRPATPPQQAAAGGVAPGPAESARSNLLKRINDAKDQGFGISVYMNVFTSIEDMVKSGATEDAIKKRVESLSTSLEDQLKRSATLKTQRAAPPIAASSPPPSASAGNAGSTDALKGVKDKLGGLGVNPNDLLGSGGKVPDNLKNQLPPGVSPDMINQFLNSDKGKQILNGLK